MASGPGGAKKANVNLKDLKKLIDLMRKAELTEVDIEQEGLKIKLRKGEAQVAVAGTAVSAPPPAPQAAAPAPLPAPVPAPAAAPAAPAPAANPGGITITAPMVGTFYRSSSPESPVYIQEGDLVAPGKTVCIIEAMKLMNEIKAEISGKVVKVLVENAQPVEYGQPLFVVEPA